MARTTRRPPTADPKAAISDWLSLVDPDGAFLTTSELSSEFPHGFEPMSPALRTELRSRVADLGDDPTARGELRRWLLARVLEWDDLLAENQRIPAGARVSAAEHGVPLSPNLALLDVDDANAVRVGVFTWPLGTRLDRRPDPVVAGDTWTASPVQRAETWCRESGVPLALVTDDLAWALVWAPRGAPAASCRWSIGDLADERVLQAGLVSVLGARRFFAVTEDATLEALFRRAADAEAEITRGLGSSVRRSVELLVAAISRDDVASNGRVLEDIAPAEVYESAVTVLMRLVFLLFAEERRLLPAEDLLWAESYSVLTLRDDLRAASTRDGEDALERRSSAWHRLLATFRAVHDGASHDRLTLPAYGGSLFDPDRFPFLEGRRAPEHTVAGGVDLGPADDAVTGPGRPVFIDDRTVLAVLDALLNIAVRSGRGTVTQRVSYKALDVEQIGHCYEGLLDHSAVQIEVLALGLIGPEGREPEIAITDLEHHLASGADALCEWLADKERCAKRAGALAKELGRRPEGVDLARLRAACGHDDATVARVLPFWGLIRTDLRGLPVVLLPGSQYVTQTGTRRSMGAQYTTKALAEEVARYALEPLVYDPGPQNEADPEQWVLRPPGAILDLRVCDPAVGSGAILTAAGRYLADRLVESVVTHGPGDGPFADRLSDLARASSEDQVVMARREVVDHCLYGVDKNPVAAEMAKLSLWLTTMARERPFTFLDHAIQVGDSLLGITDLDQLRWLHLDPAARRGTRGFEALTVDDAVSDALELAGRLRQLSVITVRDAAEKQRLHDDLRAHLAGLSDVADAVVGAALSAVGRRGISMEERVATQMDRIRVALDADRDAIERSAACTALRGETTGWLRTDLPEAATLPWERTCLHWPLSFPEVFLAEGRSGFDAIVANPPFLGGKRISGANGVAYREHLVASVASGMKGNADLVTYFLLRMCVVASHVGTLATNTLSQGDTREVGLDRLVAGNWTLYRAVRSAPWPNEANLEIAKVWMTQWPWTGTAELDGHPVASIGSALQAESARSDPPRGLAENKGQAFQGTNVVGIGFAVTNEVATELLADSRNRDVLRPFVSGSDLTDGAAPAARRWIIAFGDRTEAQARSYDECMSIVERDVKPLRERSKRRRYRDNWWQFGEPCLELYRSIEGKDRVLAMALTSKVVLPVFTTSHQIFQHSIGVFNYDDGHHFGVLSSAFHWWWALRYAATLETRIAYNTKDVFETFPRPPVSSPDEDSVQAAGCVLDEFRADLMIRTNSGLTDTYNRFHDPNVRDADVLRLRSLHVTLDHAVRDAYGWSDLPLEHHHWETSQGMRFTVGPAAKNELLDRLLKLNHERYAAEVAAGLHEKRGKKPSAKRTAPARGANQGTLL